MGQRIRWLFFGILFLLHPVCGFTPNPQSPIHGIQRWSSIDGCDNRRNRFFRDESSFSYILGGDGMAPYGCRDWKRVVALRASSSGTDTLAPVDNWKMPLVLASLFVLQAVGLQTAQVFTTAMRKSLSWYLIQLHASPLITKSVTSGVLGVCGDYMAQWLEHRLGRQKQDSQSTLTYDSRRGIATFLESLLLSGPLMHFGYNFFESVIPSGRSLAAMTHVVADSIVLDSVFVASAIVVTGLVEGYRFRADIVPQFKHDYVDSLKASWIMSTVLLPLEFVFFRYLPVSFRVLAMNFCDILWDGVVSFMAHKGRKR